MKSWNTKLRREKYKILRKKDELTTVKQHEVNYFQSHENVVRKRSQLTAPHFEETNLTNEK